MSLYDYTWQKPEDVDNIFESVKNSIFTDVFEQAFPLLKPNFMYDKQLFIYSKYKQFLYEGLSFSSISETLLNSLKNNIKNDPNLDAYIGRDKFVVYCQYSNNITLEKIQQILNVHGWLISENEFNKYTGLWHLTLLPKYTVPASCYNTLKFYHASPKRYEHKILSLGLIPKAGNKKENYNPRVYLSLYYNDAFKDMVKDMYDSWQISKQEGKCKIKEFDNSEILDRTYSVYEISFKMQEQSIENKTKQRLYFNGAEIPQLFVDNRCEGAVYSLEPIAPYYIQKIDEIIVKPFDEYSTFDSRAILAQLMQENSEIYESIEDNFSIKTYYNLDILNKIPKELKTMGHINESNYLYKHYQQVL